MLESKVERLEFWERVRWLAMAVEAELDRLSSIGEGRSSRLRSSGLRFLDRR